MRINKTRFGMNSITRQCTEGENKLPQVFSLSGNIKFLDVQLTSFILFFVMKKRLKHKIDSFQKLTLNLGQKFELKYQ